MENRKYKTLNYKVVSLTAKEIAIQKGFVTTLEVKKWLRQDGYFALQSEVSFFMSQLIESYDSWDFCCNGKFRVYFLTERLFDLGSLLPVSKN